MDLSTLPRYPLATGQRPFEPKHDRDWPQFFVHLIVVATIGLFIGVHICVLAVVLTCGQILWFLGR